MAMRNSDVEDAVLRRIVRWAEGEEIVRAVLLTSTRARAGATVDALSDYDVIFYASDPARLLGDGSWAEGLGPVLVQMPSRGREHAWNAPTRLVLYEDGTKIDFTVLPVDALRALSDAPGLPEELDAGYRVLLDKDGLAAALPAATGSAYVLRPPTQEELTAVVEEFWWETTYVAKNLWRGELLPARYSLECVLKLDLLRRMLEWRVALGHGGAYRPGVLGRGLQALLAPEHWSALEATYAGAETEEGWRALSRTIELFRTVAIDVARELALEYPHRLDEKMTRYLERIRSGAVGAGDTAS
jgi:aminoglycoside 6-adenylyltransferase